MIPIKKKAQISVFIILGLIVLLSVMLFIYFKMTFAIKEPDLIPEELKPIKRFIEECMTQSAEEAVRMIGMQGGYIKIPLNIDFNPSRYVNPDKLGLVKIPFWFYKGNRYSPSITSVQRELSKYVEENTEACINNFDAFKEQYKIVELDKMKVSTFLNKEDISLMMEYPVRVNYRANNTYTLLERFSAKVEVRLRKIIEMANKLLDSELATVFLENFTIDLMASNPDIPFTDMLFKCNILEWHINDIKEKLHDMLFYNLPRIRVKNTNYMPFLENEAKYKKLLEYDMEDIAKGNFPLDVPEDAYEYLHMFWDADIEKDDFISIGFKSVPGILDLIGRPHDNGILRSKLAEGNKKYIRFLCVNIYHFIYDVNYPVIVTIRDDASLGGFIFNFAMPVTIHNNEPYKEFYGYDMFTTTYFDRGFCDDIGDEIIDIRAYGKEEGYSNIELNEVNISLQCFKYYCPLGKTMPDQGSYRLRTALPATCANPFIIAEKEGYIKARKQIQDKDRVELELTRLKKLDYEVVYHRYNSIGDVIESWQELEEDMQVSIQLSTDDFYQYKMYPVEENVDEKISRIELVEGNAEYNIEIVLTQDDEYIGGYNGEWKTAGIDVANADKVIFHIIKYVPVPYTKEDKLKMMGYILTGDYKDSLKPELTGND